MKLAFALAVLVVQALPAVAVALPADPTATSPFLRYVVTAKEDHLDTPIVHLKANNGTLIDLVGAIHVGDRAYYQQLQKRLDAYPKLLFELVKPADVDVAELDPERGGVSGLQRAIKDLLALESQLDAIDYRRKHFVHADIAPDRLLELFAQHWQGMLAALVQMAVQDAARPVYQDGTPRFGGIGLLLALTAPDRPRELKRVLARELTESGIDLLTLGGNSGLGAALIGERNAVAVAVAQRTLAQGHRRLGIFYGAAHLPDLEWRLHKLGFRRVGVEWVRAWELGK
jgi:hypothetical protein